MGVADRKAREFGRREAEILEATLALAGEAEWQSITIDDIADRAEIGKGTFYMHFKSKDEACARIVMEHAMEVLKQVRAIDSQMEYVPRFKLVMKTLWRQTMANKDVLALKAYCDASESTLNLSEDFERGFVQVKAEMLGFMSGLMQEGIDRGIIAPQSVQYLMFAGWATMAGAMRMDTSMFGEPFDEEAALEYLTDYIIKGLMNAQGRPSA
jgi:AcrR family transcriptional regulator